MTPGKTTVLRTMLRKTAQKKPFELRQCLKNSQGWWKKSRSSCIFLFYFDANIVSTCMCTCWSECVNQANRCLNVPVGWTCFHTCSPLTTATRIDVWQQLTWRTGLCVSVCMCARVCVLVSACIPVQQRLSVSINHGGGGSELPCVRRSLTLTQSAAWSCLRPHSSPSSDCRGCDSPKRSTFLAGPRTWYLGGRASLAGTLSCRWLRADRPCSPTPGLPPCRFGICTRHSVPRPPGNVAWRAPWWCTWPEGWTVPARA